MFTPYQVFIHGYEVMVWDEVFNPQNDRHVNAVMCEGDTLERLNVPIRWMRVQDGRVFAATPSEISDPRLDHPGTDYLANTPIIPFVDAKFESPAAMWEAKYMAAAKRAKDLGNQIWDMSVYQGKLKGEVDDLNSQMNLAQTMYQASKDENDELKAALEAKGVQYQLMSEDAFQKAQAYALRQQADLEVIDDLRKQMKLDTDHYERALNILGEAISGTPEDESDEFEPPTYARKAAAIIYRLRTEVAKHDLSQPPALGEAEKRIHELEQHADQLEDEIAELQHLNEDLRTENMSAERRIVEANDLLRYARSITESQQVLAANLVRALSRANESSDT